MPYENSYLGLGWPEALKLPVFNEYFIISPREIISEVVVESPSLFRELIVEAVSFVQTIEREPEYAMTSVPIASVPMIALEPSVPSAEPVVTGGGGFGEISLAIVEPFIGVASERTALENSALKNNAIEDGLFKLEAKPLLVATAIGKSAEPEKTALINSTSNNSAIGDLPITTVVSPLLVASATTSLSAEPEKTVTALAPTLVTAPITATAPTTTTTAPLSTEVIAAVTAPATNLIVSPIQQEAVSVISGFVVASFGSTVKIAGL